MPAKTMLFVLNRAMPPASEPGPIEFFRRLIKANEFACDCNKKRNVLFDKLADAEATDAEIEKTKAEADASTKKALHEAAAAALSGPRPRQDTNGCGEESVNLTWPLLMLSAMLAVRRDLDIGLVAATHKE